ncbi:MAG: hypothetical protein IT287_06335, partial [Bdellovibrionaceae bacterium]|nr:hypothetical protein [Pseudobdellovibrionaceae bacterium]
MSSKIIVSGNSKYGLGKSLFYKFPEAVFCSRSTAFDFTHEEHRERFAK